MDSQLEKLRDELIEFEKIIAEFQKWKLIGISAVFAAGLAASEKAVAGTSAILALFAIPVVTIYADLLIRDYDIRLSLIARYLRSSNGPIGEYERGLPQLTTKGLHWSFGHLATFISSAAANGAVLLLVLSLHVSTTAEVRSFLVWSSTTGFILAGLTQIAYYFIVKALFRDPSCANTCRATADQDAAANRVAPL
jgi:hypothetical protein